MILSGPTVRPDAAPIRPDAPLIGPDTPPIGPDAPPPWDGWWACRWVSVERRWKWSVCVGGVVSGASVEHQWRSVERRRGSGSVCGASGSVGGALVEVVGVCRWGGRWSIGGASVEVGGASGSVGECQWSIRERRWSVGGPSVEGRCCQARQLH